MNVNDVMNVDSRFLKAPDLKGRKITVRVESYTIEDFKDMRGGSKKQIVLKFHGAQKVLGLNKINTKMIASMYGDEIDNWMGQPVTLYPSKTQSATGEIVDCVRVEYQLPEAQPRPAQPQPARAPQQQTARPHMSEMQQPAQYNERNPPPADDMSDDVPF